MLASRNVRLFLGFRATTRALLFAPYIFWFMTVDRGLSATEYGVLQLFYYWIVTAAEVPSGVVADRLGRRSTLLLGAVVNGLGCFLFALSHDFWTFAAAEMLFALGTAFISGADSAMLFDSLAAEGRESLYARTEGAAQALWLGVTALGMPLTDLLIVARWGPEPAYWITGVLSFAGAACAVAMREPPVQRRLTTREITAGALRDVVHIPGIARMIVYSIGLFLLLRAAVVSFFNPTLAAAAIPVERFGTVLAVMNVAGALAAFRAHAFLARFGVRFTLALMPLALLAMFALLTYTGGAATAALFCIQGAVFGAYPLVTRTILNRLVPGAERRATTLSIESMACRVCFGLLVLFSGWALDAWSLRAAVLATAALACVPFLTLPLLRRPAPPAESL